MKRKLIILSVLVIILAGCEDGNPIVIESKRYMSPDGERVATLERVDNGMGFGQGALYDEVHVTSRSEPVGSHGDPGMSVVFYAESTYKEPSGVRVTWLDNRRLRIEYAREQRPGRAIRSLNGVAVEFLSSES